jgi:NADH-quinone oxidoreductase subunit M
VTAVSWGVLGVALTGIAGAFARAGGHRGGRREPIVGLLLASLLSMLVAATSSAARAPVLTIHGAVDAGAWLGIDGLSAPLLPFLAALAVAWVVAWPERSFDGVVVARVCWTVASFEALWLARDPLVLALLWIGTSVPTIAQAWPTPSGRRFAAIRFVSTSLVIAGVLVVELGGDAAVVAPALVLAGVVVREGIFPFHAWVPRLYEDVPLPLAATFVLPQIGSYVLARFLLGETPAVFVLVVDVLAGITLLYGAALALVQSSPRRSLGYLALSQSALVLVGLADSGPLGGAAALMTIVAIGLAHTGFAITVWLTEARRGPLDMRRDGGNFGRVPALAGSFVVFGLAGVGMPGSLTFVAEDLVFHATMAARPWLAAVMVWSTAMTGIAVVRIAMRVFAGPLQRNGEPDLPPRERAALLGLGLAVFGLGLVPGPVLQPVVDALEQLPRLGATAPEDAQGHGF